jgi:uncharacterized membrane protein YebE (DUF533 family)
MDMGEILGALLNNKSGRGGAMGSILEGLLRGGQKKAPAAPPRSQAAPQRRAGSRAEAPFQAPAPTSELDDERAKLLVVAMVNAAKADGQLDKKEQDAILGQLGDVSQEEIDFLRKEFAAPLDVREFAWNVPLGLEQQVYGFSLMAIGLDEKREARYLKDLAHGLRLDPDVCDRLHDQVGAPKLRR